MLSHNRFFGNAGRSRWMAGLALPAYTGALQDWARTELAAGMPKTAAVPAGYGGSALALPREAGAFASYDGVTIGIELAPVLDAAHVYSLDLAFGVGLAADAQGLGVAQADIGFGIDLAADLGALAPLEATIGFGLDLTASFDAVAPFEATFGFGLDIMGELEATAPVEATLGFGIALTADFAGGAVLADSTIGFAFDLAASADVYGLGVWSATTDEAGGELTVGNIAAATVLALQGTNIPVDVQRVRGQALDGTGTSIDPWGPA